MTVAYAAGSESPVSPRVRPGTVRKAIGYLRPFTYPLLGLLSVILLDSVLAGVPPILFERIIDDGVLRDDISIVTTLGFAAILVTLGGALAQFAVLWLSSRLGHSLIYRLRHDVFVHLQRLPIAFYTSTPTGTLVSRLNNDTLGAQAAITGILPQLVSSVSRLAFVLATMAYLSWPVTLIAVALPLLVLLPAGKVGKRLRVLSHRRLESVSALTVFVTERLNVAGALLVRLYGKPAHEQRAFDARNADNRDLGVRIAVVSGVFSTALNAVSALSVVLVYVVGGYLAVNGPLSVGTLVALAALLPRLYAPMTSLSTTHAEMMTALAGFERVLEILDQPLTITDKPGARPLPVSAAAEVEFDRVSFGYPPAQGLHPEVDSSRPQAVLADLSFRIEAGRQLAIVGPSGAGKSTIAALTNRLYDVDSGAVRIDGQDVRDVQLDSLSRSVGMLTQDTYLFHDTIRANLRYARPEASDEDLLQACEDARLGPLIRSLPAGIDTLVGERGHRMSGGEKQRLAIARLLLRQPSVVVLDEATAHLDVECEVAVHYALETALAGRTKIVIAHRLSTVRRADEILFLEGGQIIERGTHESLLRTSGRYARFCQAQMQSDPARTDVVSVERS